MCLMGIELQRELGIRLDVIANTCQLFQNGKWYDKELCQTTQGLPCIRVNDFWSRKQYLKEKNRPVEWRPNLYYLALDQLAKPLIPSWES